MQKAKVQEDKNKSKWREGPERCVRCDFASSSHNQRWYGAIPIFLALNTDFSPVPNVPHIFP